MKKSNKGEQAQRALLDIAAKQNQKKLNGKPVVGQTYKSWFDGGLPDGSSTILKVKKYTGKYPEFFKWVVTLSAANTRAGKIEMAM